VWKKIRCGTQSILFYEFKIILMINEIVFLMLLQYCNSIKVIYVNSQNKTIKNSKRKITLNAPFSNSMVGKQIYFLNKRLQIASKLSHLPVDMN
jgi:hypothetical protein